MSRYALFYSNGEIEAVITIPHDQLKAQKTGGKNAISIGKKSVSDTTHWVEFSSGRAKVKKKTNINSKYKVDGLSLSFKDLPAGTRVATGGGEAISDEQGVSIEFDVPGIYAIWFYPPPQYLNTNLEVTIGDP